MKAKRLCTDHIGRWVLLPSGEDWGPIRSITHRAEQVRLQDGINKLDLKPDEKVVLND